MADSGDAVEEPTPDELTSRLRLPDREASILLRGEQLEVVPLKLRAL